MADWSALTRGFQEGADFSQRFRENRQLEKMRDQMLEAGQYGLEGMRGFRKAKNPDAAVGLGDQYAAGNMDWMGQLEDPVGIRMVKWIKNKFKKKPAQTQALDTGGEGGFTGSNPTGVVPPQQEYDDPSQLGYAADGGLTTEHLEKLARQQERNARIEITKGRVKEGVGRAVRATRNAARYEGIAPRGTGLVRGAAGAGAALAGIQGAMEGGDTPTEDYYTRFGLDPNSAGQSGMKDLAVRTGGVLSDVGANAADFIGLDLRSRFPDKVAKGGIEVTDSVARDARSAIPVEGSPDRPMQLSTTSISASAPRRTARRTALPTAAEPQNPMVNFGEIDADPHEVPNMQTDDWRKYRAQMIAAAQKTGRPEAVGQVNDMVTKMQQDGFLNYGKQGLALQQAGNLRGAMAAYRAAFQYFPNGNDVEFGVSRNKKTGQQQIIGFGKDEKTGEVVPGSQMVMEPERVAVLIENFTNPQAFRLWTKDWRDFQQDLRKYEEVEKAAAQSTADYQATMGQAALNQADNYALRYGGVGGAGGIKPSDVRATQEAFKGELMNQGVTDPAEALQLSEIAIRFWQMHPQLAPDTVLSEVLKRAGKLQQQ